MFGAKQQTMVYQIRVKGSIGEQWSAWFDGLDIISLEGGETLLQGAIADQAALHGILIKIRDLNLPLIALRLVDVTVRGSLLLRWYI
jgi:hypothetical protein